MQYESSIGLVRESFESGPAATWLFDPSRTGQELLAFLIFFSSRGTQMTQFVEEWIRKAGERCIELGLEELGTKLVTHAKHEAGHDQMMRDDLKMAVDRWNQLFNEELSAQELLDNSESPATKRYRDLHEAVAAGNRPWGQIAIEYEIERLSTTVGAEFMRICQNHFGGSQPTSFLEEHVAIDAGHTEFNRRLLEQLISAKPAEAEHLVSTGTAALNIYSEFLDECVRDATRLVDEAPDGKDQHPVTSEAC